MKAYVVSSQAHRRRYGSPDEIWDIRRGRRNTKYAYGVNLLTGRDRSDNGQCGK